jgi:hypothetical protein
LLGEYSVSATFNVYDLTPFEKRRDDVDQPNTKFNHTKDPLEVLGGSITIARTKKLREALHGLV